MKNIFACIIVLLMGCICFSCRQEKPHEYEDLSNLDFGIKSYPQEPINGISKYPPFSWFASKPVKVNSELEIDFNEDAIRSQSSGQIFFVDENGNRVNGMVLGNLSSPSFNVTAKDGKQIIPIEYTVDPVVGDSILTGSIVMIGNGIDKVNHTDLTPTATPIGSWTMHHKLGVNWIQWILLILICIIAIYLLGQLIATLATLTAEGTGVESATTLSESLTQTNTSHKKYKESPNSQGRRNRDPFIERCERILLSQASVSDKAVTLERLFNYWDYELPEDEKDFEGSILNPNVMKAMDELWGKYYKITKKNMCWEGEPYNSRLIPDNNTIPPNKNYSNIDNLTWGQIMTKHNYRGLQYHRGKPNFAEYAKYQVVISDFDKFIDPHKDDDRGPLQERAFEILAKQFLDYDAESMKKMKENNRWVWHEDTDCKTMYLVPQEIHNNLHHFGGVGMLRILRRTGLV